MPVFALGSRVVRLHVGQGGCGHLLAAVTRDRTARLWDVNARSCVAEAALGSLMGRPADIASVAITSRGALLLRTATGRSFVFEYAEFVSGVVANNVGDRNVE